MFQKIAWMVRGGYVLYSPIFGIVAKFCISRQVFSWLYLCQILNVDKNYTRESLLLLYYTLAQGKHKRICSKRKRHLSHCRQDHPNHQSAPCLVKEWKCVLNILVYDNRTMLFLFENVETACQQFFLLRERRPCQKILPIDGWVINHPILNAPMEKKLGAPLFVKWYKSPLHHPPRCSALEVPLLRIFSGIF